MLSLVSGCSIIRDNKLYWCYIQLNGLKLYKQQPEKYIFKIKWLFLVTLQVEKWSCDRRVAGSIPWTGRMNLGEEKWWNSTYPSLITITEMPFSKTVNPSCSVADRSDCGWIGQLPGVNVIKVFLEKRSLFSVKFPWINKGLFYNIITFCSEKLQLNSFYSLLLFCCFSPFS